MSYTKKTKFLFNTVADWQKQHGLMSEKNVVYVYTDYEITAEGKQLAAVKIGDGTTYVNDLPYCTTATPQQKLFWNNKVRCYLSSWDREILTFTIN